ncbi:hypothetical protein C8R47DRAFT_1079546 [Mycena vitilis]|nr:hypothetical protein C8R47DRAFT_1079546 [Mycena vitilis]
MFRHLPDEIVSEILSPALTVSEEMFSDIAATSPFASPSVSSSAALLVCKAWLRVATPLLYHVVVIRSKAQALALQKSLRGNPHLGRFVKMLRVEGGFGPAMEEILRNVPNVTDLFLSLQIHASDSTGGLIKGLHHINPTRMIIFDDEPVLKNKHVQNLVGASEALAPEWSNFSTLHLPYAYIAGCEREPFVMRLCACSTLTEVSFLHLFRSDFQVLFDISRRPSLKAIEIRWPASRSTFLIAEISTDLRLSSIVRFLDEPEIMLPNEKPITIQPSDPSFKPMASVTQEVIERVWSRSLEFLMVASDVELDTTSDSSSECSTEDGVYHDHGRLQLLLVSKMFHNYLQRLAIPYLYRHLVFPRTAPLRRLALQLASTPAVGAYIRSIEIQFEWGKFERNIDLTAIFCHTPHLEQLVGGKGLFSGLPTLSWKAVETLGQVAGASLQTFSSFDIENVPWVPQIFDQTAAVPREGLPALESLRLSSSAGLEVFMMEVFTKIELSSLRRVDFDFTPHRDQSRRDPTFLRKHGIKLEELKIKATQFPGVSILTLCPRISVLRKCESACWVPSELRADDYAQDFGYPHLAPGFQHACLTTLIIDKQALSNKVKDQQDWKLFFDNLKLAYFPLLREIRVVPLAEWPTTEHAISKSIWVKLAEKLLLSGIQLTTASVMPGTWVWVGGVWRVHDPREC